MARVVLRADTASFSRDMDKAERQFRGTTRSMDRQVSQLSRGALTGSGAFHQLGRSIAFASGTFLGAAGFTAVARQSVTAASDLGEQINKVSVVFRGSERDILSWSTTTANAFGISRREALEAAGTFGNMLVPMGFARDRAEEMSKRFVELSADLASFNNANPADVLEALRSGLAGETEPLRKFGVFLSQARIQQELLNAGVKTSPQSITAAQRAWATYSIVMKDAKDAQGDFGRTSGSLANQQRILHAQVENLEAGIGKALLPTVLNVTKGITGWLSQSKNQARVQRDVTKAVEVGRDAFDDIRGVIDDVNEVTGGLKNTLEILLGLKVAATLAGWTRAFRVLAGAEAAAGAGAGAGAGGGIFGALAGPAALGAGIVFGLGGDQAAPATDPHLGKSVSGKYPRLSALEHDFNFPKGYSARQQEVYAAYRAGRITAAQAEAMLSGQRTGAAGGYAAGGFVGAVGSLTSGIGSSGSARVPGVTGSITPGLRAVELGFGGKVLNDFATKGHAKHSHHYDGTAVDLAPDFAVWQKLLANRHLFAELLSPWGLYSYGVEFYDAALLKQHSGANAHIHVAYTGGSQAIAKALAGGGGAGSGIGAPPAGGSSSAGIPGRVSGSIGRVSAPVDVPNKLRGTFGRVSPVSGVIAGLAGVLGEFNRASSGTLRQTVDIPGLGKILYPYTPTIESWDKLIGKLKKKLIAAVQRQRGLEKSLAAARRAKRPNKAHIRNIQNALAQVRRQVQEIRLDLGDAMFQRDTLAEDANSKEQQAADEAEAEAQRNADAQPPPDGETFGGADSVADTGPTPADLAAAADRALTDVPADIRLALAEAQLTPDDPSDDRAAMVREQSYFQSSLGQVQDIENKISIVNQLASVNNSLRQLVTGQQTQISYEREQVSYLEGMRNLRGFASNIYSPTAALRGSNITVVNNITPGEGQDAHLMSKAIEFELRTLVG
jgi:hypothetical protein